MLFRTKTGCGRVGGGEECDGTLGVGSMEQEHIGVHVYPREENSQIQHPVLATACKHLVHV